jgi:amino acid adenylation domain-containing protein
MESERQKELPDALRPDRITRRKDNEPAPLSFAQERLWFLDQFNPNSTAYNIWRPLPLMGRVDVAALERSINEIIRRHELLRTTFRFVDARPVQVISPSLTVELIVRDLQHLPAEERQVRMAALLQEHVLRPFDLARGPLLRPLLFTISPEQHMLALSVHHIISDELSMRIFFSELISIYEDYRAGRASRLPELPIQYSDYALWQRSKMQGEVLEEHLAYWRNQLADVPPVLELPLQRPRPAIDSFHAAMETFAFPKELSATLEKLCLQESATMFMTLLAAFMVLLHKYTGYNMVAVGAPIANRNRAEIEGLIGFFTNTLVLSGDMSGDPSFTRLLKRIREVTLGAYAHADMPFERLVEELNPERHLNINPLIQVMFILQKATNVFQVVEGGEPAQGKNLEDISAAAKFDLTLYMEETAEGLIGGIEYAIELFDRSAIRQTIKHFRTLLEAIASAPGKRISQLDILSREERRQLIHTWNPPPGAASTDWSIQSKFEGQAERTPAQAAMIDDERSFSYKELNQKVNRLSWHLLLRGVGPETCVGVFMHRGGDMLLSMLSILKAGGVYLPLDPSLPQERLALMLEDSKVHTLLTHERLLSSLPETEAQIICLDVEADSIEQASVNNPPITVSPDNSAYIIYTSGSTGRPKGVVLPHRTLTGLISWQVESFNALPQARTLQYAPTIFDVSLQETLITWCSGGTLVCISEEDRTDFVRLLRILDEQAIERIFVPYVALQQMAETAVAAKNELSLALREVIALGERLKITPAIREFFSQMGGCRLLNQYGPSESHVVSEYCMEGPPTEWEPLPPIGRPGTGARFYVLDSLNNLVPVGAPGELHIGGDILSRGYLHRTDMTAEKFLPDPFTEQPGKRMYSTGDLVRYRSDGNLEFLGRIDQQLKIRGYRVEPGEIESHLIKHAAVAEALVVGRELASGERQLVAYIVPASATELTVAQLRDFLRQQLPDYMIPSHFILLDSLPLTSTGKVDRLHLPEPDYSWARMEGGFVAPQGSLEQEIAEIWSEVLGIQSIGVHDNFFDLGGHSLLATQLTSRLRKRLSVDIPLRSLFESPTIASLALAIVQAKASQSNAEMMQALLDDLERLSDDEIEMLLSNEPGEQLNPQPGEG